jgi:CheY-like chemotaxis protein
VAPAADLGSVKADASQIEQLLINLAVNARDAMPQGGQITFLVDNITVGEQDATADLAPGCYVRLAVSDTGTGMDQQTLRHLFEPFFTTKEPGRGTGLGLAMCYGIVKQHAGHIDCVSSVGSGTTFSIYLPCVEEAPDQLPQREELETLPHGSERVLLVEDEAAVRALVARVLRGLGYTVVALPDGEEALRFLAAHRQEQFDLLLTDVVMPRMSGDVLADRIQESDPAIKILFISGYADSVNHTRGRMQAEVLALAKPFAPAALARKVREVLDAGT